MILNFTNQQATTNKSDINYNCDNTAQKKNHYELLLYKNSKLKKKEENY